MDEQKIKKVLALVNTGKPYDDVAPDVTAVRNWALDLCRHTTLNTIGQGGLI